MAALAATVTAQETVEWDMVTNMSRNSYLGKIAMQFAEDVRTTTGGTVNLEFHEDGEMVPVPEILNAVSTGAVPAAFTWLGFFGGTVPVGKYFGELRVHETHLTHSRITGPRDSFNTFGIARDANSNYGSTRLI